MNEEWAGGPQVFCFSTESCSPEERIAAWREVFGRTVVAIDIASEAADGFAVKADITRFPDLGLIYASIAAPHHMIADRAVADGALVWFMVGVTVPWTASLRGRNIELQPGDGILLGNHESAAIELSGKCRYAAAGLPRTALAPLVADLDASSGCRIPASNPALQMLVRYLALARGRHTLTTPELVTAYTSHVCHLLALALRTAPDGALVAEKQDLRTARLHAMKDDIRRNIGRSDLSVHAIAARHGVSVRYVQKMFEENGCTFTQCVMEERLAAAYDALTMRSEEPISTIAYNLGFGDLSNFNRAFRQRFGCTPREVRNAQAPLAGLDRDLARTQPGA